MNGRSYPAMAEHLTPAASERTLPVMKWPMAYYVRRPLDGAASRLLATRHLLKCYPPDRKP